MKSAVKQDMFCSGHMDWIRPWCTGNLLEQFVLFDFDSKCVFALNVTDCAWTGWVFKEDVDYVTVHDDTCMDLAEM